MGNCIQYKTRDIITCPCHKLTEHIKAETKGRHFANYIFKCIFFNEKIWIFINISLKCVPKWHVNNNPALVQIMVWCRPGYKPLSEPVMVSLLTHICVTRPQWVNLKKPCWWQYLCYRYCGHHNLQLANLIEELHIVHLVSSALILQNHTGR